VTLVIIYPTLFYMSQFAALHGCLQYSRIINKTLRLMVSFSCFSVFLSF